MYWVFHPCTVKKQILYPFSSPRLLAHCAALGVILVTTTADVSVAEVACTLDMETAKRIRNPPLLAYIMEHVNIDLGYIQFSFWS